MSMMTVTFEAPDTMIESVDRIAASHELDRSEVLREALAHYLAEDEVFEAGLDEAERDIEAGNFLTHEEVESRFEARIRGVAAA